MNWRSLRSLVDCWIRSVMRGALGETVTEPLSPPSTPRLATMGLLLATQGTPLPVLIVCTMRWGREGILPRLVLMLLLGIHPCCLKVMAVNREIDWTPGIACQGKQIHFWLSLQTEQLPRLNAAFHERLVVGQGIWFYVCHPWQIAGVQHDVPPVHKVE